MNWIPLANILIFTSDSQSQHEDDTFYPVKKCSECERRLYGYLDVVTGEVIYECNSPRSEWNDNPHFFSLAIPTEEPKTINPRCNFLAKG